MPVCFQLFSKERPEDGPVVLQKVDEELCAHFGAEVDPKYYYNGWFDTVGFRLACGKSFEDIRREFCKYVVEDGEKGDAEGVRFYEDSLRILAYLEERYTSNSFYTRVKD